MAAVELSRQRASVIPLLLGSVDEQMCYEELCWPNMSHCYRDTSYCQLLGAFEKLRKATISVVISARPRGTTVLQTNGFP